MKRRRFFPRLLAECIEPIAAPALRGHGIAQADIIRHWETIVGTELARHATPHRLTQRGDGLPTPERSHSGFAQAGGGTLVIHTSGAFATELQHMEPIILERLATYFGYRAVARLKIEQVGRAGGAVRPQASKADAEMRQALRQLAESLQKEPS